MIPEPEMPSEVETTFVELDLRPEEWAQLLRIAGARGVSLEELVASAVKEYLAAVRSSPANADL
ncbi:MAG: hypothetical protein ACI4QA_03875 [Candidatus Spyradosoma sp.]